MTLFLFFFFNDTATTEIYTLSLHDALPICPHQRPRHRRRAPCRRGLRAGAADRPSQRDPVADAVRRRLMLDRKSTRLNSSHANISYAVFCLKKKKNNYYLHILSLSPSYILH